MQQPPQMDALVKNTNACATCLADIMTLYRSLCKNKVPKNPRKNNNFTFLDLAEKLWVLYIYNQ